jgi:hypothetical protein
MFDDMGTLAVAIAFIVALIGSGIGVAFLVGRRGAKRVGKLPTEQATQSNEKLIEQLQRCLEIGDYVTRDSDALAALLASQSPQVPRPIANAIQQLMKTTKSLAGRLNRMGSDAGIGRPQRDAHPVNSPIARPEAEQAAAYTPDYLDQAEVNGAQKGSGSERVLPSPYEDARRFPRSVFRGSAKATIYPRHPGPGREPVSCVVLTRDLSCGGIGIAHSEQLFPKQIVVLDAVGKLLVGEVRWCRRVDEQFYVAGCRLVKTNS